MTISSSLNAGVMGLSANSARLGTIADNIANSDTYGYKRKVTDFQSMVIKSTTNSYSAGGVRVQSYTQVDEEGSLVSTGNATDIAVAGQGFLPVTDRAGADPQATNRELLLTSTGSFSADENGYLRTPSGLFLMGWPVDGTGALGSISRQGGADLEAVRVNVSQYESTPTQNIGLGVNLPADATSADGSGATYELSIEYFDNFGRSQTMTGVFTPTVPASGSPSNTWNVELFDNSTGTPVSVSSFDVDFLDTQSNGGAINNVTNNLTYSDETGEITVDLPSGPVQVFVGRPNDRAGITQYANDFAPYNLTKDGSAVGNLSTVEVDAGGNVQAIYDTGYRRTIYKIPVADVPNPNGLLAANSQSYRLSQSSGDVYFWDAGDGPVGEIQGFALMESTTDIASELTSLIETQRAYSSNAKIIQTVDEILQETANIIR
ncbi:flagellar hook-basal body complex protein [Parvularcula sp. LCG005]|uniref:flagellar hook protein FlgE n=1 Tax=Parvularcula sp. LCG005 TaxID=3078805 RepID=UPI002941EC29|nr:flagellar hook-basal body complex protein [Parvularcula sp. LCG005]WOI52704.1 flagellar hook-basal body complex protein [Parvularcula sp. LCG005]